MAALIRRIFFYKFFPACWTILIIVLLCIPGSMVPGTGIFGLPNLDKMVHIFLFGMHTLVWGWHYSQQSRSMTSLKQTYVLIVVLTVVLGVALEYVQGSGLVSHRSFDVYDILADTVGACLAGVWLLLRVHRRAV